MMPLSTNSKSKKMMMGFIELLSVSALVLAATHAFAGTVSNELDSLGSNSQSIERASRLESRTRLGIVQGRAVNRRWRIEAGASYGPAAFGDSYLNSQQAAANLDLHINPKFSIGLRYAKAFNQLTAEGRSRFDQARIDQATGTVFTRPQISYAEEQAMGVIDWYMTYGKINLFDIQTVQFDIYSLAGYGQIKVATDLNGRNLSEWTNTWTAGAGIGFWLSQHFSLRSELRYQGYSDKLYTGSRDINLVVGTIGLGVLL